MSAARPQSAQQQINTHIVEAEVLRARIAGKSFRVIAAELGYSVGGAYEAFKRAMAATVTPVQQAADEYRTMMQERLEGDLLALADKRANGDPEAIRVGLAVEKSIRELNGYDAPTQITGDLTVNYRLLTNDAVDLEKLQ